MESNVDLLRSFLEELLRRTPDIGADEFRDEAEAVGRSLDLSDAQIRRVVKEFDA